MIEMRDLSVQRLIAIVFALASILLLAILPTPPLWLLTTDGVPLILDMRTLHLVLLPKCVGGTRIPK